jgi:histone acetyltransferase (RNA polymerase elongator complex component)
MKSEYGNHKIRPFIIPVFLPHAGCPNQCVFCNQSSITGVRFPMSAVANIRSRISEFLRYNGKTRKPVQIAFFGGNFLGIQEKEIRSLLAEAAGWVHQKLVDGIRFSTRPDTIDPRRLSLIRGFPVATVELGVQSMDDRVLAMAKRGHSSSDTEKAVRLLKAENYEIGLQIMVGLPGDDPVKTLITAERIVDLAPDFVRIYPTVVLAGSPLAGWYRKGNYAPLSLEACVTQVKELYLLFKKNNIRVIRMGLQASEDLKEGAGIMAGPYHPAFGHLVHAEIFFEKAASAIKSAELRQAAVSIRVNPVSVSKMRGLKNANIRKLKDQFHLESIEIVPDYALPEDDLKISNDH